MDMIQNTANNHAFKGLYGHMMLRFIGFCFIVFSQLTISFLLIEASFLLEGDLNAFNNLDFNLIAFLLRLSDVGKPIILCSLFGLVFEKSKKIIHALIFYFILAVLFYVGETFIFNNVLEPFVLALLKEYNIQYALVEELFPLLLTYASSYANLNVFLDMFLCVLVYLFLLYTPKNIKGKWIYVYRFLVIIPISYILGSYVLTILNNFGILKITSVNISALLVKQSLTSFIIFFALVIFIKIRKHKYEKQNNILSYKEYLKTTSYTFSYSLFLAVLLALISIIEFGLSFVPGIKNFAIGDDYLLFFAIPFVLFYNVSKPANKIWPKIALPSFMVAHYFIFSCCILGVVITILEVVSKFLGTQ